MCKCFSSASAVTAFEPLAAACGAMCKCFSSASVVTVFEPPSGSVRRHVQTFQRRLRDDRVCEPLCGAYSMCSSSASVGTMFEHC